MRIPFLSPRDVVVRDLAHWHEGTQLLGYWSYGGSYIFRGQAGHHFCISDGYLKKIAQGRVSREVQVVD